MKVLLTLSVLACTLSVSVAAPTQELPLALRDIHSLPPRVLQRSISPAFFRSLQASPIKGWVLVRANLSGSRLTGMRVIRTDLQGLYDPLALQLAKEAVIAGNYTLDRFNKNGSVLLHVLVYKIADGDMVLSFAHLDQPGGEQMEYYGCARLLVLKENKWSEIRGPQTLYGKGWAVRDPGLRNDLTANLKMERHLAAEATNYSLNAVGRRGY